MEEVNNETYQHLIDKVSPENLPWLLLFAVMAAIIAVLLLERRSFFNKIINIVNLNTKAMLKMARAVGGTRMEELVDPSENEGA